MIEFIFKSKSTKIKATLPETWDELSVKQFVAVESLEKPLEILSEVLDVDLSFVESSRTNLTPALNRIIQILNARPPGLEERKPEGFVFQGKKIELPRDIDLLMFGQLIQINLLIEDDLLRNLVKILGIAVQPIIDGEYIEEKQPYYAKLLERLPIIEVYPELFFFVENVRKYSKYGRIDSGLSL